MIEVQILSPVMFKAQHCGVGQVLNVTPLEAFDLTSTGRARLQNQRDADTVNRAVEQDNARKCREGTRRHFAPSASAGHY